MRVEGCGFIVGDEGFGFWVSGVWSTGPRGHRPPPPPPPSIRVDGRWLMVSDL